MGRSLSSKGCHLLSFNHWVQRSEPVWDRTACYIIVKKAEHKRPWYSCSTHRQQDSWQQFHSNIYIYIVSTYSSSLILICPLNFCCCSTNTNPVMGRHNVMSKAVCLLLQTCLPFTLFVLLTLFEILCVFGQEHCCKPVVKCWVQVLWKQIKQFQELLCPVCCPKCIYLFCQKNSWQFTTINKY